MHGAEPSAANTQLEVLIVGAGPTGLALAAQLRRFGTSFRIIDRALGPVRESRALAIQARTLEVLQSLGLGEQLVAAGRTSTQLVVHLDGKVAEAKLGDFGVAETRFPFILLLSQAETEKIIGDHLAAAGVRVERGVELMGLRAGAAGVSCSLRHQDGRDERVHTAYLVGCDGARSTVRTQSGIAFEGGTYLQDFVLGDVEADGLRRDALHAFPGARGIAIFFPLGSPRTWRIIAMAPGGGGARSAALDTSDLSLAELQEIVDSATGGTPGLYDPAWLTHFRLHHRQTQCYRAGHVFLAGDAAHIHSPVGGQGMNTGIQDAWNLGWKLALVAHGWANAALLDSYEAERWPVGRALLRTTDRIFDLLTRSISGNAVAGWVRRAVTRRVLPRALGSPRLRRFAFGFVSQLRIRYRSSPAVTDGRPALRTGPRAGDRLPDALLSRNDRPTHLQAALGGPCLHLLLCFEGNTGDLTPLAKLAARYRHVLSVHLLLRRDGPNRPPGHEWETLVDETGEAFARLGAGGSAQYLVRPDGHVAFRCAGSDLGSLSEYLAQWFLPRDDRPGADAGR